MGGEAVVLGEEAVADAEDGGALQHAEALGPGLVAQLGGGIGVAAVARSHGEQDRSSHAAEDDGLEAILLDGVDARDAHHHEEATSGAAGQDGEDDQEKDGAEEELVA